jgi:ABC-2 type transport system permease protein
MKSWAEEKKLGSAELLFTMPFSEWDLCLGKFLSSCTVLLVYIFFTLPVPLSLLPLARFDLGVILTEYAGALLLGGAAISLGQFLSAISKSQAAAFLSSALVLLVLMLMDTVTMAFALPSGFSQFLNNFSLSFHFESFSRGLLDSRDLAFFILAAFLFLFMNCRVLIFRKWS